MEICYQCGVKVVTVYAFSIENFNRPKYEVEGLMQLAKVKLEQLTSYGDILDRYGASVRVLGQREMIRDDVLEVVDRAVARTKHNNKSAPASHLTLCVFMLTHHRAYLNVCFPYTSRAEITTAIRSIAEESLAPPPPRNMPFSPSRIRQKILSRQLDGREPLPTIRDESPEDGARSIDGEQIGDDGDSSSTALSPDSPPLHLRSTNDSMSLPNPENITIETLEKHMYTADDPPLDIFVRTSGVERFSDFMLWQINPETHITFLNCLWPELDLKHFIWILLEWQWRAKQRERDETPARSWNGQKLRSRE
jgi:ditrans,polycis-polyprenyl diphosphate synthase